MRLTPAILALLASGTISPLFAGDNKHKPSSSPTVIAAQKIPGTEAYFPVQGESMAECKKQYDDPQQVMNNSDGTQTWVYVFGRGKLLIPYGAFFAKLTVLRIDFDTTGRVTKWSTTQQKAI
jgi:hypothetical protein